MTAAQKLHGAFVKSGMTPEQFFNHVCNTRDVVKMDAKTLAFKVEVPAYDFDIEWFGYNPKTQVWEEL